ncbi:hypothetical protein AAE485_15315 (plasmid) [Acidithiobacillus ferriphilus]|uniref:hypothetical protein n=1 Tax=Acidithiobacillus ferriphilus TaxID=1689834 RepID=UPI00390CCE9D
MAFQTSPKPANYISQIVGQNARQISPSRAINRGTKPVLINHVGYHAKIGGDLDGGNFYDGPTFFALSAHEAEVYAEHIAYNEGYERYEDAGITIFKAIITLSNAVVMDRITISRIYDQLKITTTERERFINNFEDSEQDERDMVFAWAKAQGYNGAMLPNDLMPVCAGGDWHMQQSLVAFYPEEQVIFTYSAS